MIIAGGKRTYHNPLIALCVDDLKVVINIYKSRQERRIAPIGGAVGCSGSVGAPDSLFCRSETSRMVIGRGVPNWAATRAWHNSHDNGE
jgi:hypothetical protein